MNIWDINNMEKDIKNNPTYKRNNITIRKVNFKNYKNL